MRSLEAILLDKLDCDSTSDIPLAAEQYFLGESRPEGSGFEEVDRLLQRACKKYSISILRTEEKLTSYPGRLYSTRSGFVLKIRQDLHRSSFRFVLAHELAHTLFYDDNNRSRPVRVIKNSKAEERFCDRLARHLLLPTALLRESITGVIRSSNVDFDLLERLAHDYWTFPWQVLLRALEVSGREDVVAVLWGGFTGSLDWFLKNESPHVIDSWSCSGIYIPLRDRALGAIANGSSVRTVSEGRWSSVEAVSIKLGSLDGTLLSTSFHTSFEARRHIIQVIFLDESHIQKARLWRRIRSQKAIPNLHI